MNTLSRSQMIGLAVIAAVICGVGLWTFLRIGQTVAAPGVTLREAFPQAPAAPPPVSRPAVVTTLAPSGSPAASEPSSPSAASANSIAPANPAPTETASAAPASPAEAEIVVHVAGAVRKPGVYHLRAGARGEDALKAAGGATKDANTDAINLAARLEDGTQLHFPTRKEQPGGGASDQFVTAPKPTEGTEGIGARPLKASGKAGASRARSGGRGGSGGRSGKLTDPSQGKVNLNAANAETLQRIPGIGPAMAERVLAYRKENGGFRSVEDLLNVSGIGEKKFAKMQPFVRVK